MNRTTLPRSLGTAARNVAQRRGERRRFAGSYQVDDRRSDAETLIVILAGYKDYLWPWTLARVRAAVPPGADVCIASSGRHDQRLARLAEAEGWSYLSTEKNNVSLVQNLAIRHHPRAKRIIKLDEDIFVGEKFFELLLEGYERVQRDARWFPGVCSPLLNVNGYSYVDFLETLELSDAYAEKFGPLTRASGDLAATDTGEAARWLWSHALPFDATVARFAARPFTYSAVPHRFSIGAVLFERAFWEGMGGFWVSGDGAGLGADEEQICRSAVSLSRVIVVLHGLFAGHFAFGPQEPAMRAALDELRPGLGEPDLQLAA